MKNEKKPVTPQVPALPGVTPLGLPRKPHDHAGNEECFDDSCGPKPKPSLSLNQVLKKANDTLKNPCTSYWLKTALEDAMKRDLVDAANDAVWLAELLKELADAALKGE